MGRMEGKVALITGGARGQGRAHAIRLAQEGADIALFDIVSGIDTVPYDLSTPDDLAETAAAIEALDRRVITIPGDTRNQSDLDAAVERTIAQLGDLDVLVQNAGIWAMSPFWETSEEEWRDQIDVNLTGHWHAAKAVAPHFIKRRGGAIVFTSSGNGIVAGVDFAHYTAAKHGVIGLMKTVAMELGPYGVRANAVAPGFMDTPMNTWQGALDMVIAGAPGTGTMADRENAAFHMTILAGHGLVPANAVSQAVLFLASDEAADITGVVIPVDAGRVLLPGFNPNPVREK
jgi:SDR family mycofactocin-dependent oxidoreductase